MTGIERTLQLKNFLFYNFVFWVLLCFWELIKIFSLSQSFGLEFQSIGIIRWPISAYLAYWILSYMVFDFYQLSRAFPKSKFIVYHIVAAFLFGILHKFLSGISGLLLERLFLESETRTWRQLLADWNATKYDILGGVIIYWLILLILIGLDYYRKFNDQNTRRLELEGELSKAQLKSMKMQLNPHFLFNAFNTISMMVRQKKTHEAVEMIGGFSDMCRLSLNKDIKQVVTLAEEVELIKKYMAIESLRYQDRLTVEWEIDEKALKYKVPSFLLQPLVENAFKHGISKTFGEALIKITVKMKDDRVYVDVFNTGSSLPSNWELQRGKGIGLANTIDRMLRLYKEQFKFVIDEHHDGVSMTLSLPIR